MADLEVITIETGSLGDRSYIAHDGTTAIVVDPPRDIDRIESQLTARGLRLELILETHVHNDYVSGGLTLSRTTSSTYAHAQAETLHFDHQPITPGERLAVGDMDVEVVATPGHTEHHLAYVVRVTDQPPVAFTGGSLLYGTVGRTDLVDAELTDELTRQQHRSTRALADRLPDDACIYPTHGFGSFCASAGSGDDSDGTLATERRVNLALTIDDEDQFVERLVSGLTAYPAYYAHMAPINRAGGVAIDLSPPALVEPTELARRIHSGEWVVDLRQRKLFANEHLTGTIGIELADDFATYLGWLIPWGMPLTLLADTADQIHDAQRQLARIGIGGINHWGDTTQRSSYPVEPFAALAHAGDETVVLDVRRDDEYDTSHLDNAVHIPLDTLTNRIDEVPNGDVWVHCASGFRASIAASILDRAGHTITLIDDDYDHASDSGIDLVRRR
jgi:hydroxyacylglutathione hydrolase